MKRKNFRSGLTLIELLVALGLFSVVTFAAYSFFGTLNKRLIADERKVSLGMDLLTADRVLREDLLEILPSLNNITQTDNQQRRFFDYMPDLPCRKQCERTLALSLESDSYSSSAHFLVSLPELISPQIFHPMNVYDIPAADSDQTEPAVYKGLSHNDNFVTALVPATDPDEGGLYTQFWDSNEAPRLLYFYTPMLLRKLPINMNEDVPRASVYLGQMTYTMADTQAKNIEIKAEDLGGAMNLSHPMLPDVEMKDGSNESGINGFDRFLRTAPSVGGGTPLIFMRAVNFIRYELKKNELGKTQLWRTEWDSSRGAWKTQGEMLVEGLYGVVLKRRSISSPVITYVLAKDEGTFNRALQPPGTSP